MIFTYITAILPVSLKVYLEVLVYWLGWGEKEQEETLLIIHFKCLKCSMVMFEEHQAPCVETYGALPCSVSTLSRNCPCWLGSAVEGMMT